MDSVPYYLSLAFVILVCSFAVLIFYVRSVAFGFYGFLFGTQWKNIKECVEAGYHKVIATGMLMAMYDKKLLEVRLSEHTLGCEDCKADALDCLQEKIVDGDLSADLVEGIADDEKQLLQVFENHGFDHDTIDMFEFRITIPRGRRRKRSESGFKLRLPQWASPQGAV